MKRFRYLENATTLGLDRERCIGCGRCVEVCPHGVFAISGKRAVFADRDGCIECGACMVNCPVDAITVEAGVGCATGMITEWLREKGITKAGSGCCS